MGSYAYDTGYKGLMFCENSQQPLKNIISEGVVEIKSLQDGSSEFINTYAQKEKV